MAGNHYYIRIRHKKLSNFHYSNLKNDFSRPNSLKKTRFSLFFTPKNPSKFPPVWPVPIETPQPSLQSLIPPYWPSTHPTCPILTWDISIHHTIFSGIASPSTKPIFSIFDIIPPYSFFSHPTCQPPRQPVKFSPQATRPLFYMRFPYVFKKIIKISKI